MQPIAATLGSAAVPDSEDLLYRKVSWHIVPFIMAIERR